MPNARIMAEVRKAAPGGDKGRKRGHLRRPFHRTMRRPDGGKRRAEAQGNHHPEQDWKAQDPHHAPWVAQQGRAINGQRSDERSG